MPIPEFTALAALGSPTRAYPPPRWVGGGDFAAPAMESFAVEDDLDDEGQIDAEVLAEGGDLDEADDDHAAAAEIDADEGVEEEGSMQAEDLTA